MATDDLGNDLESDSNSDSTNSTEIDDEVLKVLFDNMDKSPVKPFSREIPAKLVNAREAAQAARAAARNNSNQITELAISYNPDECGFAEDEIPAGINSAKLATFFRKVKAGVPLTTALQFARIGHEQAKSWFERGVREPASWYGKFVEEYDYCRSSWEIKHIQQLQVKAKHPANWKLNLELLKLQRSENWAQDMLPPRNQQIPVTNILVGGGRPMLTPESKMVSELSLEEIEAYQRLADAVVNPPAGVNNPNIK